MQRHRAIIQLPDLGLTVLERVHSYLRVMGCPLAEMFSLEPRGGVAGAQQASARLRRDLRLAWSGSSG